jgi:hypothetical protein
MTVIDVSSFFICTCLFPQAKKLWDLKKHIYFQQTAHLLIPVAMLSKASVCGHLLAGIKGKAIPLQAWTGP